MAVAGGRPRRRAGRLAALYRQLASSAAAQTDGDDPQNELGGILVSLNIVVVVLALIQQPVFRILATKCCAPCVRWYAMRKAAREWASVVLFDATDAECVHVLLRIAFFLRFLQPRAEVFQLTSAPTLLT